MSDDKNTVTVPANPAVSKRLAVVRAPGLTVRAKDGLAYCATSITTCSNNGRWGLSFLCSGGLFFLPWEEVESVGYYPAVPNGREHCDVCDARLVAWPSGEGDTGAVTWLARQEDGSWLPEQS